MATIINGMGKVGIRIAVGASSGGGGTSYLLDTYGGAAAAYSLRKLSSTYSGSAIRVRRSSDNTEQNIGFDGSGNLDEAALTAFVGAGNGFVVTWFDQSGNGNNSTQSIASNQPQIVTSGVVNTINSKPTILFNSKWFNLTSDIIAGSSSFCSYVGQRLSSNTIMTAFGGPADGYTLALWSDNKYYLQSKTTGYIGSNSTDTTTSFMLLTGLNDGTNQKIYKNNSEILSTFTSYSLNNIIRYMGNYANSFYTNSYFSEVIFYNSDQSSNRSGINSNINTYYSIYSPVDSDAQAFITAASITDSTQQSAVNTLVTSLKSAGLWTKMKAIYPFVGGTASAHKFNLKDPRDLDAAYRLVFNGGWTHSSTGALPNGSNGYADTKIIPANVLTLNSNSYSYYSRTTSTAEAYDIGAYGGASPSAMSTMLINFNNNFYASNNDFTYNASPSTGSQGLFTSSRTASNVKKGYKNTTTVQNVSTTSTALPGVNAYIGAIGGIGAYGNKECAFAHFGDGLTDADISALYTAVQAFQTTLGRQVA